MARIKVVCTYCDRKDSFGDYKDITYNRWHIVAWNVADGFPIVCCDKCPLPWLKKEKVSHENK